MLRLPPTFPERPTVATVVNTLVLDADSLDRLLEPRDDVVTETALGDGRFESARGPFSSYLRTVTVDNADRGSDVAIDAPPLLARVTETTRFRLSIPFWGMLFVPLYRRELRRVDDRRSARYPVWAPPDRVDARAATVLGLLCTASLVAGYLGTLLTQTITFAADEFGSSDTAQSTTLASVRVGVLLSVVLVAAADRRGRRRMLLLAAVGACLSAATGAVAPNLVVLGATQTVSRAFTTTLVLLITIVAAEEMPAGSRAYSVSVMTMTGALGAGMALWALPLADVTDRGWRILYLIPLLGLPLIAFVGRRLPESLRFVAPHPDTPAVAGHGRRLWVLGCTFFLISAFGAPATQLLNEFLREERGFSAARISLFTVLTSTPGAIGLVVGGRIADVRGRRAVVALGVVGGAALTMLSFNSQGWPMWIWNMSGTILAAGAGPALNMYGPELFPTGSRGRANGIITVVSVLGSAVGLVAAGVISDSSGGLGRAMQVLLVGPLIVGVVVLLSFPETAHRELEELNPEDRLPPGVPPAGGAAQLP